MPKLCEFAGGSDCPNFCFYATNGRLAVSPDAAAAAGLTRENAETEIVKNLSLSEPNRVTVEKCETFQVLKLQV